MKVFAARPTKTTVPIHVVRSKTYEAWLKDQPPPVQAWLRATGFKALPGQHALLPDEGGIAGVVYARRSTPTPWGAARLSVDLPKGRYALEDPEEDSLFGEMAALGWALGTYEFARYRKPRHPTDVKLVWPSGVDKKKVTRLAEATFLVRDLITTPANDMGPAELEKAARELATRHRAKIQVTIGKELLRKNYPTIHAVGRASDRAPRLIDLRWGRVRDPKLTLVGKGVCFDSGGLDLKPAGGMLLMKKDMGGAAHVLGLAHAIMDAKLRVRLRVLVPAVENSVGGDAFRPLDVIKTRKGLTVEVGNTDAEGRLVMCDAIADAVDEEPELLIDFATLTGAARVALGTEMPALFSNDDAWAEEVLEAGLATGDPLWRMPLFDAYDRHLKSSVADLNNVASSRYGGAITAALFLRRFVGHSTPWMHVDVMAWNSDSRAGRPKGGEAMGLRAFYEALAARYG